MGKVVAPEERGIARDFGEGVGEAIVEVGTDNLNLFAGYVDQLDVSRLEPKLHLLRPQFQPSQTGCMNLAIGS